MVTPEALRKLVSTMRELGVISCCGIVLGPEPPKLEQAERATQNGAMTADQLESLRKQERREEIMQAYRDRLPGHSDAQLMRVIPPGLLDDS